VNVPRFDGTAAEGSRLVYRIILCRKANTFHLLTQVGSSDVLYHTYLNSLVRKEHLDIYYFGKQRLEAPLVVLRNPCKGKEGAQRGDETVS
jgi:hypothetical protein